MERRATEEAVCGNLWKEPDFHGISGPEKINTDDVNDRKYICHILFQRKSFLTLKYVVCKTQRVTSEALRSVTINDEVTTT